MKTYNKRFNAQRSARAELGDDAIEGVNYRTFKTEDGAWTWQTGGATQPEAFVHISDPALTDNPIAQENVASWPSGRRAGKRRAIIEQVQTGTLPEPPDFSAETHKRFRAKLEKLVALADAGDIDGLNAMIINPVSSSPKAMARYRDLSVIALEARK